MLQNVLGIFKVQFSSVAQSCLTFCDPMNCSTPGLPVYHQLLEFSQTHVHWVSAAFQPSCPLLSPSPPAPSIFYSIRVFSNESALCIRWPKYWNFSFNISPSNEYLGLISFRMDWLDLLSVQGTLKSLLQHHSSKASILRHSAFCIVQLSHPYVANGKTIALTRRTFVVKVMSLPFNMLSRLVITFLPRSNCLLISWLQSPSAVILYSSCHLFLISSASVRSSPCLSFIMSIFAWDVLLISPVFLKRSLVFPKFSSVQFSRSVMSDSLWPHELQHIRPPCPSPTPGVHSNSRPSSRWCHQPS